MDINLLRGIITAISLIAFIALVWWAWSGRQRKRFEEASMLPFDEPGEQARVARTLTKGRQEDSTSPDKPSGNNAP